MNLPKRNQFYLESKPDTNDDEIFKDIPNVNSLSPHFINEPINEDLNMQNHKIVNLQNPKYNNDAVNLNYLNYTIRNNKKELDSANKSYIDQQIKSLFGNLKFKDEVIDFGNIYYTTPGKDDVTYLEIIKTSENIYILGGFLLMKTNNLFIDIKRIKEVKLFVNNDYQNNKNEICIGFPSIKAVGDLGYELKVKVVYFTF